VQGTRWCIVGHGTGMMIPDTAGSVTGSDVCGQTGVLTQYFGVVVIMAVGSSRQQVLLQHKPDSFLTSHLEFIKLTFSVSFKILLSL